MLLVFDGLSKRRDFSCTNSYISLSKTNPNHKKLTLFNIYYSLLVLLNYSPVAGSGIGSASISGNGTRRRRSRTGFCSRKRG